MDTSRCSSPPSMTEGHYDVAFVNKGSSGYTSQTGDPEVPYSVMSRACLRLVS